MRTPIAVPCMASVKRGRASGSAALRIACQETARSTIDAHMSASAARTHGGLESSSVAAIECRPMRCPATATPPRASAPTPASATRRAVARRRAPCGSGSSGGIRRAGARVPVTGTSPSFSGTVAGAPTSSASA